MFVHALERISVHGSFTSLAGADWIDEGSFSTSLRVPGADPSIPTRGSCLGDQQDAIQIHRSLNS